MLTGQDRSWRALARAVDVAIARDQLEPKARSWGKIVLLEAMAGILGVPATKLRNQYYRDDPRLEAQLLDYAMANAKDAAASLRALEFRRFAPIVWKRPVDQLAASRASLRQTITMLRIAERQMRAEIAPPIELRREIGTVAAEVMACALTFFDGERRWLLLQEADVIFRNAMGPLTLVGSIAPQDGPLFARFWENRATPAGLEWSNIWDDPATAPTVGIDVIDLALDELEQATDWMHRHWVSVAKADGEERVRQFRADKAKWLAKAGRFEEAREQLDASDVPAARADKLLVRALEQITSNALDDALRTGSELAELLADTGNSIAPVTSAIMVHNIELMRGKRQPLTEEMVQFLRESPVAASEHVNLPRYRRRLEQLGYSATS